MTDQLDPFFVRTYTGATPDVAGKEFVEDAAVAASTGYFPTSQQWHGTDLTVVYQLRTNPAATPAATPGAAPSGVGIEPARAAAGAWVAYGILIALLGVSQLDLAGRLRALGIDPGSTTQTAYWNLASSAITAVFAYRLFQSPTHAVASNSLIWAAIAVAGGVLQVPALGNGLFLLSIVAASAAGFFSWQARERLHHEPEGSDHVAWVQLPFDRQWHGVRGLVPGMLPQWSLACARTVSEVPLDTGSKPKDPTCETCWARSA